MPTVKNMALWKRWLVFFTVGSLGWGGIVIAKIAAYVLAGQLLVPFATFIPGYELARISEDGRVTPVEYLIAAIELIGYGAWVLAYFVAFRTYKRQKARE